jgi:hypothetical protein
MTKSIKNHLSRLSLDCNKSFDNYMKIRSQDCRKSRKKWYNKWVKTSKNFWKLFVKFEERL